MYREISTTLVLLKILVRLKILIEKVGLKTFIVGGVVAILVTAMLVVYLASKTLVFAALMLFAGWFHYHKAAKQWEF